MDGQSAEVEHGMGGSSGGSGTTSSSRWNPTKEQISLLENLYKEGIRTPNAEQIEQITNRLRAYGQIEGKNVFYWFQNHKARQRQRQKQERNAYFNRFLHTSHPTFSSLPCQNGWFSNTDSFIFNLSNIYIYICMHLSFCFYTVIHMVISLSR